VIPALSEMTVEEKLRLMEALWEDLSRNSNDLESPAWQEAELQEREKDIAAGRETFTDWEKAKIELRQQLE
jgi:putative addiction module component (TIGR02574 family)